MKTSKKKKSKKYHGQVVLGIRLIYWQQKLKCISNYKNWRVFLWLGKLFSMLWIYVCLKHLEWMKTRKK